MTAPLAPAHQPARVGPYRIIRPLGAGGMGAVYLGRHEITGEPAAVKLIRPEFGAAPEHRERLRREVAAARRVPRFCTAPVIAADPDADTPWIATEYLDAPTLDVALIERGRLTGTGVEALAVGVAVALRAIHQEGVVHRDLKPSNILLSPWGPRVIDFGIARTDDAGTRLTRTGDAIGTPAFMAPEQLRGELLTAAVDIFAWGSLLTFAAIGRPPFGTGPATAHAIQYEPPDLGDLAEPLRSLVAAALHKQPARRPTAGQLVERLSGVTAVVSAQVLAAATRTPAPPEPQPARSQRGWVVAAAIALTAATLTLAGVRSATSDGPGTRTVPGPPPELPAFGLPVGEPIRTDDAVLSVATGVLDGVPIAVTAVEADVWTWDLDTRQPTGPPFGQLPHDVRSVAFGTSGGAPVILGARSAGLQMWEPARLVPLVPESAGPSNLTAVAAGELGGVPIAVTTGWDRLTLWDLDARRPAGDAGTSQATGLQTVAVGGLDGATVAVTGGSGPSEDGAGLLERWDLGSQPPSGVPFAVLDAGLTAVHAVAVGTLDDTPVAVSGSVDGTVRVWDLASLRPIGEPLTGHTATVTALAVGEVGGTLIAVTGSADHTVRAWDLATREPLELPAESTPDGAVAFTGHTGPVRAVAITELYGGPVAVTGGDDRTIRIWSLATPDGNG